MPAKQRSGAEEPLHFKWKLFERNGVYYADGRGCAEQHLGKHSLGTRSYDEALQNLQQLDRRLAVQRGLVLQAADEKTSELSIAEGWALFMEYCNRPQVLGGVSENTRKRYRAVRDKHVPFCAKQGVRFWTGCDKRAAEAYGSWLVREGYSDRTQYLELNLLVSIVKWLIEEKKLPAECRFRLQLSKPDGSDTYCYTREQVTAMIDHCGSRSDLGWLREVLIGLATTGMRVGEFTSLRWADVDFDANTIRLTDERASSRRKQLGSVRRVKGKRGRAVPLHPTFRSVLEGKARAADGQLFHGPRGGKLKPDYVLRTLVSEVIEPLKALFPTPRGEIGFEHGRVHSFRHFFVSEAFRQGVTEAQIMDWVGHKDSSMVRLYRHLRPDDGQRRMNQLDFGTGGCPPGAGEPSDLRTPA